MTLRVKSDLSMAIYFPSPTVSIEHLSMLKEKEGGRDVKRDRERHRWQERQRETQKDSKREREKRK